MVASLDLRGVRRRGRGRRHARPRAGLGPGARQLPAHHARTCCTTRCCRGTPRWNGFFRRLQYVIVDECHAYRGVFGSHVAQVLRRLRRVAAHHASAVPASRASTGPVFLLASATISEPGRLRRGCSPGGRAEAVTADSRAARAGHVRAVGAAADRRCAARRARRSGARATAEAAGLLADLVPGGVPALAFVRSRRGAEAVAQAARRAPGARRARPALSRAGRRLPVRLPARGPAGAGGGAAGGRDHRRWPPPPRWSSASTSPAWTRC